MSGMAGRGDAYGLARADAAFHRGLCKLGGNRVISDLWEALSRQATVVFGLSAFGKSMSEIVEEHRLLVRVFRAGDASAMAAAIDDHINVQTHAIDFEAIIAARRRERDSAASGIKRKGKSA